MIPSPPISPLSLHDALPISLLGEAIRQDPASALDLSIQDSDSDEIKDIKTRLNQPGVALFKIKDTRRVRDWYGFFDPLRSEEHTSELQSRRDLVCRLLLEKK